MGGDRRHHGGMLCAPVTGLGECRERRDEARSGHGGHGCRGDGQTRDPLRSVNLFAWQCSEVIATGSEVLSLGHCAVPFLFRALSDWASERFPIEIIMRLNWDCCI